MMAIVAIAFKGALRVSEHWWRGVRAEAQRGRCDRQSAHRRQQQVFNEQPCIRNWRVPVNCNAIGPRDLNVTRAIKRTPRRSAAVRARHGGISDAVACYRRHFMYITGAVRCSAVCHRCSSSAIVVQLLRKYGAVWCSIVMPTLPASARLQQTSLGRARVPTCFF